LVDRERWGAWRRTVTTIKVLYLVLMVAAIVTVDVVFLRNRFRERLFVNIGIVAVFLAFYLLVLR
jgi:hypothetical protein